MVLLTYVRHTSSKMNNAINASVVENNPFILMYRLLNVLTYNLVWDFLIDIINNNNNNNNNNNMIIIMVAIIIIILIIIIKNNIDDGRS